MTLKHSQGHWKWYEWAKLNEYYPHAKFGTDHIYGVWENRNIKVFAPRWPASQTNTDHYIDSHFSCGPVKA